MDFQAGTGGVSCLEVFQRIYNVKDKLRGLVDSFLGFGAGDVSGRIEVF